MAQKLATAFDMGALLMFNAARAAFVDILPEQTDDAIDALNTKFTKALSKAHDGVVDGNPFDAE